MRSMDQLKTQIYFQNAAGSALGKISQAGFIKDGGGGSTHRILGSYALVYSASGKAFTLDLGKLTGQRLQTYWFDPRNGTATFIAEFDRGGHFPGMEQPRQRRRVPVRRRLAVEPGGGARGSREPVQHHVSEHLVTVDAFFGNGP